MPVDTNLAPPILRPYLVVSEGALNRVDFRVMSVSPPRPQLPHGDLDHIPSNWRQLPKRWGHPLHSVCSYLAMFPPQIASFFIQWLTEPGDGVYDPFAGRGTVPLEAVLLDRVGFASDANPLAIQLAKSKVNIPSEDDLIARLDELEASFLRATPDVTSEPPDIRMLYTERTLAQLVFMKSQLSESSSVDMMITSMVLGMLHANHSKAGATRGFSISMPNTFAMSPRYVEQYIRDHRLRAPEVNTFGMLRARAKKLDLPKTRTRGGRAWAQDATKAQPAWMRESKPKLVMTSPPYLQVIAYGKYNWVRLWFLGHSREDVDAKLMSSASLPKYLDFMERTTAQLRRVVADDGYVCLVIGDVRRGEENLELAEAVRERIVRTQGWYWHGTVTDSVPLQHKVSRIWKESRGRATKTDRIVILSPNKQSLPPLSRVTWPSPNDWSKRACQPA